MQEMARMLMRWSDVWEKVHWPLICVLLLLSCSWLDVSCSFSQTHSNWMRSSGYRWGVEGILLVNIVCASACVSHLSRRASHMCTQACDGQTFRVSIKWVTRTQGFHITKLCLVMHTKPSSQTCISLERETSGNWFQLALFH